MTPEDLARLRDFGRLLDDFEKARIANGNRIRAYEEEYPDEAHHLRGAQAGLLAIEKEAEKALVGIWRKEPLAEWGRGQLGVGEKSLARLIAVIGDPIIATPHYWESNPDYDPKKAASRTNPKRILMDEPPRNRTISQLWAYCGVGNPDLERRVGMKAADAMRGGNNAARVRLYVMGEAFVKTLQSPYRTAYDERRAETVDRGWTKGHSHNDAMRIACKEFLRDLWLEGWRLRTTATGEVPPHHCGSRGLESQRQHQARRGGKVAV